MSEFLNFSEISQKINFKDVLNWLNLPFSETQQGELKGEHFIVTVSKNLYFNPSGEDKGSVINFVANHKGLDLRGAAKELKDHFLAQPKEPKREIPELELNYCPFLKERDIPEALAREMEFGFVKQRSIMAGKLAFKTYDENGKHSGYVGYDYSKDEWFFPKNFKRTLYNAHRITSKNVVLTVSIFECIEYSQNGFPAVSLIGKTMTDIQAQQLSRFEKISVVHSEPDNIVIRLARSSYVKALSK